MKKVEVTVFQLFQFIKYQNIGKASADIIVAVIATFVSLFNPFVGLLISLAWAMIPFFKESAT